MVPIDFSIKLAAGKNVHWSIYPASKKVLFYNFLIEWPHSFYKKALSDPEVIMFWSLARLKLILWALSLTMHMWSQKEPHKLVCPTFKMPGSKTQFNSITTRSITVFKLPIQLTVSLAASFTFSLEYWKISTFTDTNTYTSI